MLSEYIEDLEEAWVKAGEKPLIISFRAKIGVSEGTNICEISISFIKERIKHSSIMQWNPNQGHLFDQIEKMNNRLKKDGVTMKISSGEKSVTLGK